MIVIVDNKRPTGTGESLSGAKAFFINEAMIEDWDSIERHKDFQRLNPAEQADIRDQFCVSVQRFKALWSTRFYLPRSLPQTW